MDIRKRTNEKLITRIKRNNALFDKRQKGQKEWEDLYRSIDKNLPTEIINKVFGDNKHLIILTRTRL